MNNYKHILLAYDYAENNEKVAQKARTLADQYQAKLSFLHVLDDIAMPDTAYGTVLDLTEKTDYLPLEEHKTKLIALAESLNIVPEQRWLIWGNPKQEIVELAIKQQVDLIVVGSHGRHGLAVLLGSTANGVLHYATCDVLAVRL